MSGQKDFELKRVSRNDTIDDIYRWYTGLPSALCGSLMEREVYLNELTRQMLRDEPTSL